MRITREKQFYKLLLMTALPIGVQNLIIFGISMMDTLMLGSLGEVALSATALANNVFFVFTLLMFGLAGGSNVMIAQYWGKNDVKSIHKILAIMYRVCLVFTFIFVIISVVFPEQVMSIFTTDQAVIEGGAQYLRIVAIGYGFYAVTNCTIMILRSVQTVKIAMVVYVISLVVNTFFNWVFIFGKLGAPALGVRGAAIGTVIARITEFAVILIFMAYFEKKLQVKWKDLLKVDKQLVGHYLRNCMPVVFNELLWSIGVSMSGVVVGRLGTNVVAANSITNIINQLVIVFIQGVSNAGAAIIGNTVGQGDKDKVREYANTIILFSIVLGLISGVITYLVSPFIIAMYNVTEVTKAIAMDIVIVTAVTVFFKSLAMNTMVGILRGGGDATFVFINDLIFMWLIAIPFGFLAAFVWELPIIIVFFILRCDEMLKVIASLWRIHSGKWIKDVTVVQTT
ncbi:MATE family efflux transporter [Niameybacter massiliensis]|uniref:MATE family efflux transporter n=1 Tax=Holtiella tumoricola TaxID=3018743 RepID=A0AA42DKR9_9FIRM|nr:MULTISPECIES: MATE family efflux transporter [Lachnospirales]MDA3730631.1 MATE family efflux transporter [Holtiella tumoricola]